MIGTSAREEERERERCLNDHNVGRRNFRLGIKLVCCVCLLLLPPLSSRRAEHKMNRFAHAQSELGGGIPLLGCYILTVHCWNTRISSDLFPA